MPVIGFSDYLVNIYFIRTNNIFIIKKLIYNFKQLYKYENKYIRFGETNEYSIRRT